MVLKEALGGQLGTQKRQRVGVAVTASGQSGPAGGGEVGPLQPDSS
jgi:hypothetical protein